MEPYYQDDSVTLYHGDCREVITELGDFDACIADPPYGTTNLEWDRWPTGWIAPIQQHTNSLWCFGTMRMLLNHLPEFEGWRFAQDVIWAKEMATTRTIDRFRRQHDTLTHWFHGAWTDLRHCLPQVPHHGPPSGVRRRPDDGAAPAGARVIDNHFHAHTPWEDNGLRYMTSIIAAKRAPHRDRSNSTQKPLSITQPLIEYSVPPHGVLLDPFSGSGAILLAARQLNRRAVGIEINEAACEQIAKRLDQMLLPFGES